MGWRNSRHRALVDVCNKLRAGHTDIYADCDADLYADKHAFSYGYTYGITHAYLYSHTVIYVYAYADTIFHTDRNPNLYPDFYSYSDIYVDIDSH